MNKKVVPVLCTYFDFADALPHNFSRRQILRLSDLHRLPHYTRVGFKGEPVLSQQDVICWIADTYLRISVVRAENDQNGLIGRKKLNSNLQGCS